MLKIVCNKSELASIPKCGLRPRTPYLLLLVYPITCVLDGFVASGLQHSFALLMSVDIAVKVVLPLGCLVLLRGRNISKGMLWSCSQRRVSVGEWSFIFVLCMGVTVIAGKLGVLLGFHPGHGTSVTAVVDPVTRILMALYLSISAGVFEEIFFRGGLWILTASVLVNKPRSRQKTVFVIASSVLFSVAHFETGVGSMASALIVGISFSYFYLVGGTLSPIVAAHVLTDYVRALGA